MASYNKFNITVQDFINKQHDFSSDTFKVLLTNVAPVATNAVVSDLTEISAGNGYTAGGTATTITESGTSGTRTVFGTNVVFTASGGSIAAFRYAVLYNSGNNKLISWWDYGSSLTLNNGDALTVTFDATNGIFQIS